MTSNLSARRWHLLLRAGASVVLALGVVTACGSNDDSGDDSSTTAATVKSYDKSVAGVVEASEAFLATLDDTEKTSVQLAFTQANVIAWSNLPCGATCRPGIALSALDDDQVAAAKSVLVTALGTGAGTGYDRVSEIFLADDYLGSVQASSGTDTSADPGGGMSGAPDGGMSGGPGGAMPSGGSMSGGSSGGGLGGYSSGNYYMAFLGTPSTTDAWQLHFGGHHLAVNLTYKAGAVEGASPFFVGVEPTSWSDAIGATHQPLQDMKAAMLAMTTSLSTAEQTKAKLSQSFSDVLVGPGEDGQFPAKKLGLAASALTAAQKKLVLAAIKPWVANADDATATSLMSTYESEIDKTYIGWSGTTGLTKHADYVRIDGPSVWVEFVCQNGVVLQDQIHYHTVYRDHTRDYGGEFTFS
ncbi:putative membrane protein YgcG [Actinoplanes tereljensis]|uniref:DUF3500 domain-containing protein n=1 Tax=Paractinoplanes tereljensis TaxID=571912 RepID=A0A919P0D9_9ACTN|nr:DUF3500 domain-containing protein [Actinoplanes tereljensis]GIF26607.1 hypothetical protein Ate02nite_93370 [Actinoplanes tereljensis]